MLIHVLNKSAAIRDSDNIRKFNQRAQEEYQLQVILLSVGRGTANGNHPSSKENSRMHIHDLILLVIESENEEKSLRGRTALQKKLYFLSVLMKDDSLGFRPHYYGPYSSPVAENLDILVHARFLKEITESFSTDQDITGEIRRHTYSFTPHGETVMAEIRQEDEYAAWKNALDTLNSLPMASDFNTLSIAAKVYCIVNRQRRATTEQIQQVAKEYGWNIDDSQIDKVRSFLEALSLISVGKSP